MAKIRRRRNRSKKEIIRHMAMERAIRAAGVANGRIELIQSLIPIGLEAVNEELQAEVTRLTGGSEYERTGSGRSRWGSNPGSVCLGGQKVVVEVPRVRDMRRGREVPLEAYQALQKGAGFDEHVFRQLINGMSAGRYEEAAELVPETFGVSKSSVSRRFKRATEQKLRELRERDLSQFDIVAMFIDGKHLSETDMVIAQGITLDGKKVLLGFIETSTENASVCKDFVKGLVGRGLGIEQEILCVIDGAPGIGKALKDVLGDKAIIQRCQWHKRENVLSYLPKMLQEKFRMKLQAAYEQPTYEKAKARLMTIRKELQLVNESAVASLDEGLEETLTLHRLGLFKELGKSFKTTNCIENVNRGIQRCTGRVCRWQNSNQRQRWLASALLELEPKLRRVDGYKFLQLLRERMEKRTEIKLRKAA
jgi:transposase-like protein